MMGPYDFVAIVKYPTIEAAFSALAKIGTLEVVKTETFPIEEVELFLKALVKAHEEPEGPGPVRRGQAPVSWRPGSTAPRMEAVQQIRGSGSPTSMSTIRLPPRAASRARSLVAPRAPRPRRRRRRRAAAQEKREGGVRGVGPTTVISLPSFAT